MLISAMRRGGSTCHERNSAPLPMFITACPAAGRLRR